eukprot:TRINITY_DN579_c0_g1_i1.p1 TRINITY_DN579_c0_g1~~TRINITY_DN579_c0_g1_i1.p1  ORF type:complete len:537 (-),score=90.15 TRINITY_DN579_c0_g1_i1:86-1696(-)
MPASIGADHSYLRHLSEDASATGTLVALVVKSPKNESGNQINCSTASTSMASTTGSATTATSISTSAGTTVATTSSTAPSPTSISTSSSAGGTTLATTSSTAPSPATTTATAPGTSTSSTASSTTSSAVTTSSSTSSAVLLNVQVLNGQEVDNNSNTTPAGNTSESDYDPNYEYDYEFWRDYFSPLLDLAPLIAATSLTNPEINVTANMTLTDIAGIISQDLLPEFDWDIPAVLLAFRNNSSDFVNNSTPTAAELASMIMTLIELGKWPKKKEEGNEEAEVVSRPRPQISLLRKAPSRLQSLDDGAHLGPDVCEEDAKPFMPGCFPGSSLVQLPGVPHAELRRLVAGQKILALKDWDHLAFEPVLGLLHSTGGAAAAAGSFLALEHETGTFRASRTHLVFVRNRAGWQDKLVTDVRAGDVLMLRRSEDFFVDAEQPPFVGHFVIAVRLDMELDPPAVLRSPLTASGTAVVDRVVASVYAATGLADLTHGAAHSALFMLRAWHLMQGQSDDTCWHPHPLLQRLLPGRRSTWLPSPQE